MVGSKRRRAPRPLGRERGLFLHFRDFSRFALNPGGPGPALVRRSQTPQDRAGNREARKIQDFAIFGARDEERTAPFPPPEVSLGRGENILDGIFPFA